jgi:hypothetical protein
MMTLLCGQFNSAFVTMLVSCNNLQKGKEETMEKLEDDPYYPF